MLHIALDLKQEPPMGPIAIVMLMLLALSSWTTDTAAADAADQNAERHMAVARYYVDRRLYTGALHRFKIVVARFQSSPHAEEALAGLSQAYLMLGLASEASTVAAVLRRRFPDSPWTAKAHAALRSAGIEPDEDPTPGD